MTDLPASTAPAAAAHPLVQGRCPACRGASLFLGSGGYVTCARLDCPNPSAADQLLHGEEPDPTPADDLGFQLYRAQDALAFVAECCDIADREQRTITTGDVREWLKGARCGRQLAADATAAQATVHVQTPDELRERAETDDLMIHPPTEQS